MGSLLSNGRQRPWPNRDWWVPALVIVVTLGTWEALARAGALSALVFPAPSVIGATLGRLVLNGELGKHTGATLSRLFLGFSAGSVPGVIVGLMIGWSRRLRVVIDPFIAAAHPVPKIAILPLLMIIFGIGELSKTLLIALGTFFPMSISTMAGVRQISPIHYEVAENYNASWLKVLTRVVMPGSLPMVLTGVRLAVNVALLLTVAVELVAAQQGLGTMIWFAWETLRTEELYASIIVTALIGITFNFALQRLTARLVPWQVERQV